IQPRIGASMRLVKFVGLTVVSALKIAGRGAPYLIRCVVVGGFFIGAVLYTGLILTQMVTPATFDINANTEVLFGRIRQATGTHVEKARLCHGHQLSCENYSGVISLQPDAEIKIARQGTGPLRLQLMRRERGSVMMIHGDRPLEGPVNLEIRQ